MLTVLIQGLISNHRIISLLSWKGPSKVIWSNPPAKNRDNDAVCMSEAVLSHRNDWEQSFSELLQQGQQNCAHCTWR